MRESHFSSPFALVFPSHREVFVIKLVNLASMQWCDCICWYAVWVGFVLW